MEVFDACWTCGQEPDDCGDIGVFLNFKLLGRFKTKSETVSMLIKIIDEAPAGDCRKFFEENKNVLLKNLLC